MQEMQKTPFDLWVKKIPWRRKWQSTPVFLPGKSNEQRSLAGYSPWGHKKARELEHDLATKQQLLFYFKCIAVEKLVIHLFVPYTCAILLHMNF